MTHGANKKKISNETTFTTCSVVTHGQTKKIILKQNNFSDLFGSDTGPTFRHQDVPKIRLVAAHHDRDSFFGNFLKDNLEKKLSLDVSTVLTNQD